MHKIFVETSDNKFIKILSSYKRHPNPILLAVYRGKASEGTDFKDSLARAVILVGMPCPNTKELGVEIMRVHKTGWYENQVFKAVNQAIGRSVRHNNDWAEIFLLDVRYRRDMEKISKWCRDGLRAVESFNEVSDEFKGFVMNMKKN